MMDFLRVRMVLRSLFSERRRTQLRSQLSAERGTTTVFLGGVEEEGRTAAGTGAHERTAVTAEETDGSCAPREPPQPSELPPPLPKSKQEILSRFD